MANDSDFVILPASQANRGVVQYKWEFDTDGDGDTLECANFSDRSVVVHGTWDGASVSWYGSHDGVTWDTDPLTDSIGVALTMTADSRHFEVLQNVRFIRPVMSSAGTTSLVAVLTAVAGSTLA